jgi:cell wall-associated NlpC family hydrolase
MSQVPDSVKPGDYGLVPIPGRGGRLIRLGQFLIGDGYRDYQHAFVYVGNGEVIEASGNGAVKKPYHYANEDVMWSSDVLHQETRTELIPIELTDLDRSAICQAAEGYLGVPYSWLDYFAIAAHRFHLSRSDALQKIVASTRRMICSQLVDQCFADAGVHLFDDGRWPGYVTPGDLTQLLFGNQDTDKSEPWLREV